MLQSLKKLDLKRSPLSYEAVQLFVKSISSKECCLEKLDLTGCSLNTSSLIELEESNKRNGNIIIFGAYDDTAAYSASFCTNLKCC